MIRLQRIRGPRRKPASPEVLRKTVPSPLLARELEVASVDAVHLREDRLFILDDEVIEAPKILHHTHLECPMVVDFPTSNKIYRVVVFGERPADYGLPHENVITLWDLLHQASHAYGKTHRFSPKAKITSLERLVRYGAFLDLVCTSPLDSPSAHVVCDFMRFVAYTMLDRVKTLERELSERHALPLTAFERKVFGVDSLTSRGIDLHLNGTRILSISPILKTQYSRLYMPSLWEVKTANGDDCALFTLTPMDLIRMDLWLPKRVPLLTFDRVSAWWRSGANILSMERILTGEYEGLRPDCEALDQQSLQALSAWHQNVLCHYAHMVRLRFETESIDA